MSNTLYLKAHVNTPPQVIEEVQRKAITKARSLNPQDLLVAQRSGYCINIHCRHPPFS